MTFVGNRGVGWNMPRGRLYQPIRQGVVHISHPRTNICVGIVGVGVGIDRCVSVCMSVCLYVCIL